MEYHGLAVYFSLFHDTINRLCEDPSCDKCSGYTQICFATTRAGMLAATCSINKSVNEGRLPDTVTRPVSEIHAVKNR